MYHACMIDRPAYLKNIERSLERSPICALLGPRQCGKTTLARMFAHKQKATFLDLESQQDRARLTNPELALGEMKNLVIIDEIQAMPELFNVLRVLADRVNNQAKFLILGSASPSIIRGVFESLAGRVEFVELAGFDLKEATVGSQKQLWVRGGFPRSFLAESDEDSAAWREAFLQTFLERDIPQLGINIPPAAMRRFWTMLANYHGQIWNASEFGRSMGVTDKTVRGYLDILTGTYLVRQLQPWFENIRKRQVKSPKIYLRDPGILHALLSLPDQHSLMGHPAVGASWKGFVLEQAIRFIAPPECYFWATHQGAGLDLFFIINGRRFGMEVKLAEAPKITRSMRTAHQDLNLEHLWILYPGAQAYPVAKEITVWPLAQVAELPEQIKSV